MYIFLDTETTDLPENKPGDLLTQLAYLCVGEKIFHRNMYFKPNGYQSMSINAMVRTKITPELLETLTLSNTAEKEKAFTDELQLLLDNPMNTLVCHNTKFDMEILRRKGFSINCKVICTYRIMKFINDQMNLIYESTALEYLHYSFGNYKYFDALVNKLGIADDIERGAHDALYDCVSLFMLFKSIQKHYKAQDDLMIRVTNDLMFMKYVPFGKNKGTLWEDLNGNQMDYYYSLGDEDICYTIDRLRNKAIS